MVRFSDSDSVRVGVGVRVSHIFVRVQAFCATFKTLREACIRWHNPMVCTHARTRIYI